ncbi:MAG: DUF4349 domain-containing protein [Sporichthyaceae bacterium]
MTATRAALRTRRLPPARRAAASAGALLLAGSLAACGGGGASGTSSSGDTAAGPSGGDAISAPSKREGAAADLSGGSTNTAGDTAAPQTSTAARVLPSDRDVVYTGSISVRVKDVGRAADRVESLALGVDGIVFSEESSTDPRHPEYGDATLTIRVPPTAFGPTLDAVGRLGRELGRQRSAEDVTTQVTDSTSRLRTQQRSVDRVRVLLGQAKTIGEVVQVESELSRREADLESLEAQLKKLDDLTSLATIDVRLTSPRPSQTVTAPEDDSALGFLSGLRGGWDAFVAIVLVALTVLGAVLPFVVAAGLLGGPLLLLWRSRRRTTPVTATPTEP